MGIAGLGYNRTKDLMADVTTVKAHTCEEWIQQEGLLQSMVEL